MNKRYIILYENLGIYADSFISSENYLKGMTVIDLELNMITKDGVAWSSIEFVSL